jgi:hypothetical protein
MATGTGPGTDSGLREDAEEVGCAEAMSERLEGEVELHELASCYPKDSGPPSYSHRWSYRSPPQLPLSRLLFVNLSTCDDWDAVYTSGSFVHIDYKGTSCHTLFLSLHNCCKQLVFDQQTLVLFPGLADPPHCSGCGRVRCNGVARDH